MKNLIGKILAALSVMMLSGCSLLSPVKSDNQTTYVLNSLPCNLATYRAHATTLMVMQPEISQAYNTTEMAYSIKPYQIAYFSQNRWAETPAQMFYPLLVQTLQNTHFFHAVVTAPYTGNYDYILTTQILQLLQDFSWCPARVQFTVRVQLSKVATGKVIATKQFTVLQPFRNRFPYAGVFAANHATAKMLQEITQFSLDKIAFQRR